MNHMQHHHHHDNTRDHSQGHGGHTHHGQTADAHAHHSPDAFRTKFWVSLGLTLPIVYLSHTVAELLGYAAPTFTGSHWVAPMLGTVLFLYGGLVFLRSARAELASRQPGMMTLISLAISVAFVYSWSVSLGLPGMDFWWELATLITIMLLGHWLEMASVGRARGALGELAKLVPDTAEYAKSGEIVPLDTVRVGDELLVRPGSRVPVDGEVIDGHSDVDEALVTGESKAVHKQRASTVIAGTSNGAGALTVRVTKRSDETMLAGIMRLVRDAEASKSRTQILADQFAGYLFYVALGAAVVTALGHVLLTDYSASYSIERVVTVLVVACPHALGLAVPLVTALSTSLAARRGILVRRRQALEQARAVDVVLFDKTGTLTQGKREVVQVVGDEQRVASLAAAVEQRSEHSIGGAIVAYAKKRKLPLPAIRDFFTTSGKGVGATVDGKVVLVGSPTLLQDNNVYITTNYDIHDKTSTTVYVAEAGEVIGVIALADAIRQESLEAVGALQRAGKEVAIVTGDSEPVAAWVAGELAIDRHYSHVLPADKAKTVEALQAQGRRVAFVGDGINDAPALAQADVGIAIGAGTDVAIESAGIVLASSDPRGVAVTLALSRATYRKMVQNLVWGAGYNVVAIPLAMGLVPGMVLSPAAGAVLMSASTIVVALNAQLLRRAKLL